MNADGHKSVIPHSPQRGLRGVQIVCPNPTCSYLNNKTGCIINKTDGWIDSSICYNVVRRCQIEFSGVERCK
jgi:hypothetical protein